MKPILEDVSTHLLQSSFYAYSYTTLGFDFKWHFHPEYELTYIVKGNGYRLIGNSHNEFTDGDFVLIGPNLPHTWVGKATEDDFFEAIVIQIPNDFVQKILNFKETNHLKMLFEKSNCGLFFDEYPMDIIHLLRNLTTVTGIEKIVMVMRVLSALSLSNPRAISSKIYKYQVNEEVKIRVNTVCVYLQKHYSNNITLKEVSDLVFMTESNFCKFFKKTTGITFSNYLNELRINAACKMLINTDENISSIAYGCGYESLSYFNRVFLKKKHMIPKEFRRSHSNQ